MTVGFINRLPKAEIHMHLEGSIEPELMLGIGRRSEISLPWPDVAALKAIYRFRDLQSFLDLYWRGMSRPRS